MTVDRVSVVAVWIGVAIAVVAELLTVARPLLPTAFALTVALAVVVAMAVQLAVGRQRGFVLRLSAATTGAFAVVTVGAVVALAV